MVGDICNLTIIFLSIGREYSGCAARVGHYHQVTNGLFISLNFAIIALFIGAVLVLSLSDLTVCMHLVCIGFPRVVFVGNDPSTGTHSWRRIYSQPFVYT